MTDTRAVGSELVGSAGLAGVVVASGIAGDHLAPSLPALALLCNSLATAGVLYVLITIFGPVSGAHFNPVVTLIAVVQREVPLRRGALTVIAQCVGCVLGVMIANVLFGHSAIELSTHVRDGRAQLISEVLATAGLLFVITALRRQHRVGAIPAMVATYIGVAYFAFVSTSFANPAITVGRMFTDTFAGIAPHNVIPFVLAQCLGGPLGSFAARQLIPLGEERV